jgi:hypothetical protein
MGSCNGNVDLEEANFYKLSLDNCFPFVVNALQYDKHWYLPSPTGSIFYTQQSGLYGQIFQETILSDKIWEFPTPLLFLFLTEF